ncbi:unnamed protein product [Cuscuta campestris]|uniref:Uncharacterized protein n=1 Tax=Cuscuta campestris TaxID=132261 RepID=A0A484LSU3_9ASTE|nr:unnamed protein product [Cuscuta campestris]
MQFISHGCDIPSTIRQILAVVGIHILILSTHSLTINILFYFFFLFFKPWYMWTLSPLILDMIFPLYDSHYCRAGLRNQMRKVDFLMHSSLSKPDNTTPMLITFSSVCPKIRKDELSLVAS